MGLEIDKETFTEEEYRAFSERLQDNLVALRQVLARPRFGIGPLTVGAELELALVDDKFRPLPRNQAVIEASGNPMLCEELNRYNLEWNLKPGPMAGKPFSALANQLTSALTEIRQAASKFGGTVATIGILPTLTRADVQSSSMTDRHRYRALSWAQAKLKEDPYQIEIQGEESLVLECDDVTCEGANTSFQLHLRIDPSKFPDCYNAAQLATGPALALAANSPVLLGKKLWAETRIALFRQAVDDRPSWTGRDWRPARVSFGHGWMRREAFELFAESVALYPTLLPVMGKEDPLACARSGGVPKLSELRLHQGTVWHWNRAIYDDGDGGHLRIEFRALPSGPTVKDMVANAAFLLGLTLGLAPRMAELTNQITFGQTRRNFYEAANKGLAAQLLWPGSPLSPHLRSLRDLMPDLLAIARDGLSSGGVTGEEASYWLDIIHQRASAQVNGAIWQRKILTSLERRHSRQESLEKMLELYLKNSASDFAVHEWPLEIA